MVQNDCITDLLSKNPSLWTSKILVNYTAKTVLLKNTITATVPIKMGQLHSEKNIWAIYNYIYLLLLKMGQLYSKTDIENTSTSIVPLKDGLLRYTATDRFLYLIAFLHK